MPALVIGAVAVPGVVAAPRTYVESVDRERAFDGTMLATKTADDKDSWAINVSHITAAELTALEAALVATPPITCSGDLLGGSVSCHIEKHGSEPMLGIRPLRFSISFTLHRV